MDLLVRRRRKVAGIGLACATGAVGIGIFYLVVAGAPMRMVGMNMAAYLVGLAAFATLVVPQWRAKAVRHWVLPVLGLILLATALTGASVEGASRWVMFGPLTLQVSLVVLPLMLVLFARAPAPGGAAGLAIAALALALQPDRAMAGALVAGLAALAVCRRDRFILLALVGAAAGFGVSLAQPDRLPAVPFVDQILYSAFDIHPLVGAVVLLGAGLLILPALVALRAGVDGPSGAAFGAVWLAILVAAAFGNYPTPLVGYGGSAIVGYLLGLAVMVPGRAGVPLGSLAAPTAPDDPDQRRLSARLV